MTKKSLLTFGLVAATSISALASGPYLKRLDEGVAAGVSHDGSLAFGCLGRTGDAILQSYTFSTEEKKQTWVTLFTEEEPDKAGQVIAVNAAGMMAGALRDTDWRAPFIDPGDGTTNYIENEMLFTACVWKDGKLIKLDHELYSDPALFVGTDSEGNTAYPRISNGFYANAISEDGKTVTGYILFLGHYYPIRWDWDDASNSYLSTRYELPSGVHAYRFVGTSRDMKTMVWNNSGSGGSSFIWRDGRTDAAACEEFVMPACDDQVSDEQLLAISPNGKLAVFECYRNTKWAYGVINLDTNEFTWLTMPSTSGTWRWFAVNAVTNDGMVYMVDYAYQLHVFDSKAKSVATIHDYLNSYDTEIPGLGETNISTGYISGVSDDGNVITGSFMEGTGLYAGAWVLVLPEEKPTLLSIDGFNIFSSSVSELTAVWNPIELPAGYEFNRYVLNIDGTEYEIDEPAIDENGDVRFIEVVPLGAHNATLYAVATDSDGNEHLSSKVNASLYISPKTSLYFFEDLDDSSLVGTSGYAYVHDTMQNVRTTDGQNVNWYLDVADFDNNTPHWESGSISKIPWDTYLESRWFDASSEKDFYFTYMTKSMIINSAPRHESNTLHVEYSFDGENWNELHSVNAAESANWKIHTIDLDELEGKTFKIRIHLHGEGTYDTYWAVDYYGIVSESKEFDAPKDLIATTNNAYEVKLAWKNNMGAYEVSHNYNSPRTYVRSIGNAGLPLYVACDYDDQKLQPFVDKYITGVTTMIYDGEEQIYHTTVEAIVYDEDLNELSRGLLGEEGPWYDMSVDLLMPIQHITLDEPVKIEAGKTYRVAIRISDYEPDTCPIWYFSGSDDYIPGVTDLYCDDDEGETWKTMYDLYAEESVEVFDYYGRCIFNINPCITDEPKASDEPYAQKQWFYQVFRDGEMVGPGIAYFTQQSVTDTDPGNGNPEYRVQAYRRDGSRSKLSEALTINRSGVDTMTEDIFDFSLDLNADTLDIHGIFDAATLYDLQGVAIARAIRSSISTENLENGLYLLVVEKDGQKSAHKVLIRR